MYNSFSKTTSTSTSARTFTPRVGRSTTRTSSDREHLSYDDPANPRFNDILPISSYDSNVNGLYYNYFPKKTLVTEVAGNTIITGNTPSTRKYHSSLPDIDFEVTPPVVVPDIFTVPEVSSNMPKHLYDWVNKYVQLGHLTVSYTNVNQIWTCTILGDQYFSNLMTVGSETTKTLSLLCAAVFFKSQLEFPVYSYMISPEPTDVTSLGDDEVSFSNLSLTQVPSRSVPDADAGAEDASGVETLTQEVAQNTTLTTISGVSTEQVISIAPDNFPAFIDGGQANYDNLVDRNIHVTDIEWTTAQAVDAIIATVDMPLTAVANNIDTPNVLPFLQYTYSRPNMTHSLLANSTEFHSGTLVMAIRYNNRAESGTPITSCSQLFAMPHVIIQACSANTGEIEVPYLHPLPWNPNVDMGVGEGLYYHTIYFGVTNALGIGSGGSTTVTLQLYTKFTTSLNKSTFAMLRNNIDPFSAVSAALRSRTRSRPPKRRVVPDGPAMSVIEAVPAVLGTVDTVVGAVEATADGIGKIFSSNNQDRPITKFDFPTAVITAAPNMPSGDGAVDAVSMRLRKTALTPFIPDLMPVRDNEYDFAFLKTVKGKFSSFPWGTSNIRGDQLFYWKVTPIVSYAVSSNILFSTVSELSSNFTFFKGNLNLEFLFGSSLKHSGRLIIVFSPDDSTTLTIDDAYAFPFVVFDLKTQQIFQFHVPNSCPTHLVPIFSTNADGTINGVFTYGSVYVFVETPLKILNSVASSIDITVLLNADSNYDLFVPRPNKIASTSTVIPTFSLPDIDSERTNVNSLLTSYIPQDVREHTIGENINLFASSRRLAPVYTNSVTTTTTSDKLISIDVNFGSPVVRATNAEIDIVTQMHDGFRFSKGSINYYIVTNAPRFVVKHVPKTDAFITTPAFSDFALSNTTYDSGFSQHQILRSVNGSVFVSIPYYNQHNFLTNNYDPDGSDEFWGTTRYTNGCLQIILQDLRSAATYRVDIYRALGDDAEMFCYQGFPPRTTVSLNSNYNNFIAALAHVPETSFTLAVPPSWHADTNASGSIVVGQLQSPGTGLVSVTVASNQITSVSMIGLTNTTAVYPGGSPTGPFVLPLPLGVSPLLLCTDTDSVGPTLSYPGPSFSADSLIFSYRYLSSTSLTTVSYTVTCTSASGVVTTFTNTPGVSAIQLIPFANFIDGSVVVTAGVSSSRLSRSVPDINSIPSIFPILPSLYMSGLLSPLEEEDFQISSLNPVSLETVWREGRKSVPLPRKPCLKDLSISHYLNKSSALKRLALKTITFTNETHVGDIDLMQIASGGLSAITGNFAGLAGTVVQGVAAARALTRVDRIADSISSVSTSISDSLNNIPALVQNQTATVADTVSTFGQLIVNTVTERFREFMPAAVSTITSLMTHIYCLFSSMDTNIKIASFLGLLATIGVISSGGISHAWSAIKAIFNRNQGDADTPEEEMANHDYKIGVWFKLIVPALVSLAGVPSEFAKKGMVAFRDVFMLNIRACNDMTRFVNFNLDFVRDFYFWLIGEAKPELPAAMMLSDRADAMKTWATAVMKITQGHMRDRVFASSGLQKHLDLLFIEGTEYLSLYRQRNLDSSSFMSLFRRLSDLHSTIGQRVGRGRLVKEPITFWFTGAPGVGKSNVATKILTDVLVHFNVVYDGPAIYVRNFTDYWNGWADQPGILWDDWGQNQSEQIFAQSLAEYFSITSIAEFNANMPAIEDKDRMVNPDVTGICANEAQIRTNLLLSQRALNRRRDFLIKVEYAPHITALVPAVTTSSDPRITEEDLLSYNHLRFTLLDRLTTNPLPNIPQQLSLDQLMLHIKPRASQLRTRLISASNARQHQMNTLSPDAWRERLAQNIVPVEQRDQIAAALNVDPLNITLTSAIQTNDPAPLPDCDFCIETGDRGYGLPHETPLSAPELFHDPGALNNTAYYESCICDRLPQIAEFCPNKLSYFIPPDRNPWLAPPTVHRAPLVEGGEIVDVQEIPWPEPRNCFVKLWEPCSDVCLKQMAEAVDFNGNPDAPCLKGEQINNRWLAFVAGWRQRYGVDVPILGLNSVSDYCNFAAHTYTLNLPFVPNIESFRLDNNVPLVRVYNVEHAFHEDVDAHVVAWNWKKICLYIGLSVMVCFLLYFVYRALWLLVSWMFPNFNFFVRFGIFFVVREVFNTALALLLRSYLGDIASSGDVRTATSRINVSPIIHHVADAPDTVTPVVNQISSPINITQQKIVRNTMVVEAVSPSDPTQRHACMIFAVVGRKGLMPWHYVSFFKTWQSKNYNFTLHTWPSAGNVSSFNFDPDYLSPKRIRQLDLCTIDIPVAVPPVPSTVGIFSETKNATEIFDGNGTLYTGHDSKNSYDVTTRVFSDIKFSEGETSYDDDNKIYMLGYSYPFSQAGACMSVLVDKKTKHIIGFHTTGNADRTRGYATVCVRDMIKHLAPKTTLPDSLPPTTTPIPTSTMMTAVSKADLDIRPVCAVPQKMALRTNIRTNIEPTIMTGVLTPPSRFPAILSLPDDIVPGYGPLLNAIKNEFVPYKPFPKEYVDIASNDLKQEILVKCSPTVMEPQVVRSDHEAIAGIPGVAFCEGLKLNTSAGWPLCSLHPGSHKSTFIETDEQRSYTKMTPILAEMVKKEETLRRDGVIPFSVYADFGKDERLKPGKNMRLINGCPLPQTILWRKYCMDFFSAFQNSQLKVGSAIGINPFGTGMQEMAQHLLEVGNNILAGDYKNFGPTLHAECVDELCSIMDAWYTKYCPKATKAQLEEASRVRRTLVDSIINSYHIAGDLIYQTFQGSPSGNPYTAPINTIIALLYLRIIWQKIFSGTPHAGMSSFHSKLRKICYGDDVVMSIALELLSFFNNITLEKAFAEFGLIFTNPQKTGEMEVSCPINKASFLKCTFAKHSVRDIYVAHLDLSVVLDIVNWCRRPVPDMMAHLLVLSDQVLRFLTLYGPDVYNENALKLAEWFADHDVFFPYNEWSVADSLFDGEGAIGWIDEWW